MRLALYQPDIAGNVGAILRLAACLGVAVDLIEPMGFAWGERAMRRAGMDYLADVEVTRHADWAAFEAQVVGRIVLLSTAGAQPLPAARFRADDTLLLGSESSGVPDPVHASADLRIRVPMRSSARSLNVALTAAIVLGEPCGRSMAGPNAHSMPTPMLVLDDQQAAAKAQFEGLRDRICAAFEAIEAEAGSEARFAYIPWDRADPSGEPGGGGVRGVMTGRVFEKVGVNVSTVGGTFEGEFGRTVKGAADDPRFFATGISLVAHMANPHVPAVHMNLRFLRTTTQWFGGGADLNPPLPRAADTAAFHAALRTACDRHDPAWYPQFRDTADTYFFIPHRGVHRGVGGIFYDHLELPFADGLALAADVGEAFLAAYPAIVRARAGEAFTAADLLTRDRWRGRYAEFNLVHDRGTLFGLKTGGNIDAILMSLPPVARWD